MCHTYVHICVILCVFEHKNEYLFVYVQQKIDVWLQNNDMCAQNYYIMGVCTTE